MLTFETAGDNIVKPMNNCEPLLNNVKNVNESERCIYIVYVVCIVRLAEKPALASNMAFILKRK